MTALPIDDRSNNPHFNLDLKLQKNNAIKYFFLSNNHLYQGATY